MSEVDELLQDDISILDEDVEETPNGTEQEPTPPATPATPPTPPVEPDADDKIEEPETTPPEPVTPTPLTEDNLRSIISDLRREEYQESSRLNEVMKDVQRRYYPDGISRILTDKATGRELRTAQDILELSNNPELTIEEAERWRLVEQAKLDAQIAEIESSTRNIAEQTIALDRGAKRVQEKYAELFKAYPDLERKVTQQYLKTVNIDQNTKAVLSAPLDIVEYYDTVLEPYRMAFETSQAAAQAPAAPQATPPPATAPPKPNKDDRLDEHGDGGISTDDTDDPNDFEAQLKKEFNA